MNLSDIFTSANRSDTEVDKIIYSRDATAEDGECLGVVWPRTAEELHKLFSYSRRNDVTLVPRGAGTANQGQCIPQKSLVVDMSKMNKILEIGDDYVIVQAGVVLDDLNRALKDKFFPVIPYTHKVCTVGGMIAANAHGLHSYYGKTGKYVIALEVVDGAGRYLKMNSSTIKNFIGFEGTSGIIVGAKLRILPKQLARTASIFKFNTVSALVDKVMRLKKENNALAIEYFDERASVLAGLDQGFHILVEYNDNTGNIKGIKEVAEALEMKEKIRYILYKHRYTQIEDPYIPDDKLAHFLHWLSKNQVPCFGHLNINVLHPCFKEFSKMVDEMYEKLSFYNGRVSGEWGWGLKRKDKMLSADIDKMKLKNQQLDPKNLMNRGKVYA
ncbi:FAD-binding oxidoreductase [archaeon]|jgi:FAD/FMN-containing dehydrogenase|nr:FAD-binding oxidoreductase [archaeon]MBT4397363.1 FAD-binding oxidoreductase [archaeon]MBT4440743.1 FAD-binding oxidoreductase [archaeon]